MSPYALAESHSRDSVYFRTSMAQTGGSGLLRTPNAETLPFGEVSFNYHQEEGVDSDLGNSRGPHNTLLLAVGLFPDLEVSFQNTYQDFSSCANHCDLSASAKLSFDWLIPDNWFQFAIGGSDLGGQAVHHRTYYGVASKQLDQFRLSLGFGENGGDSEHQMGPNYLSGPFGGIEYQPWQWLQVVADYDGSGMNAGIKAFTPQEWLPLGMTANLTYQAYSNSDAPYGRDNQWLGLGLTVPLAGTHLSSRYERGQGDVGVDTARPTNAVIAEPVVIEDVVIAKPVSEKKVDASVSPAANYSELTLISNLLVDYGFENVSVGESQHTLLVKAENNLFNRNELDAIGVILGVISELSNYPSFEFVLLNNNIPVLSVAGSEQDLHAIFQADSSPSTLPRLAVNNSPRTHDKATWLTDRDNTHTFKPRVILSPSLYSTIGTERGVFDYSLALSTNVQLPIWTGGSLDVRHLLPLSHSDDFEDGKAFADARHKSTVDRILFHQGFKLPADVFTQFSVGQIKSDYVGGTAEFRWQSPQGAHKLGLEASYYENREDSTQQDATPVLAHYRYYFDQYDWALEANAGEYWHGDSGFTVTSKHWFGDTAVSIFYQHTDQSFAGLNFSIPLSFRKDMAPDPIQIKGTEEWTWGYRTMVRNQVNRIDGDLAQTSDLQNKLDRSYYNRDRLSARYINANLTRLKDAYVLYR
ncbi:hypothetical protein BCU68_09105 [Vibrio sp. 10N.286.49.B3]|nr:hypothetical protein BCU68_09105 [Vibrio sp. 10N.286.49.B3]